MRIISEFTGFDWDKGNRDKNWLKHKVPDTECEEVFFNIPLVVFPDKAHGDGEDRYYVLGTTNSARLLFIVFTRRGTKIRVISARDMTKKERRHYHEAEEECS